MRGVGVHVTDRVRFFADDEIFGLVRIKAIRVVAFAIEGTFPAQRLPLRFAETKNLMQ